MIKWLCIGMLLGIPLAAIGQPSLSVDKTQALIGDQIELTLRLEVRQGEQWINADVIPADTVASIETIQSIPPLSNIDGITKQWTIAVFDTGFVTIPALPVIIERTGTTDTLFTNDIPLRIEGVLDSAGMAPIKPLVYEPVRWSDYLPYAVIALVLALLVTGAYFWSKRPRTAPEVVEIVDQRTPAQIAFDQLDALEAKRLWQKGDIKEYHSALSRVVREYLENRYRVHALESTTSEIILQLRHAGLDNELLEETRRMMQTEDLVKFAKAKPAETVHAEHMEFAREFVRKTRIIVDQTDPGDA